MDQRRLPPSGDYQALDGWFQENGVRRVFLICGNSLSKLRIGKYFAALEARTGIQVRRFSAFRPNPSCESALEALKAFQEADCDLIAAAGGGSAMDVAKCVKLWGGGEAGESFWKPGQAVCPSPVPFLAIPTTAGTGSEATRYAVIYAGGEKQSIAHPACVPSAVMLDPSALEALPDYHRKASMLDALCHGLESFWSVHATEESRDLSRQALRGVLENLGSYLRNEPAGNAGMLEAAHAAGKAIDRTQTTAGHAMSYKLTSLYGIAHGHAAALCVEKLWPYMMERAEGMEPVFQDLAAAMGCETGAEAQAKYSAILAALALERPRPKASDFPLLVRSVNPVRLKNNPVPLGPEEIDLLYRQILPEEDVP